MCICTFCDESQFDAEEEGDSTWQYDSACIVQILIYLECDDKRSRVLIAMAIQVKSLSHRQGLCVCSVCMCETENFDDTKTIITF